LDDHTGRIGVIEVMPRGIKLPFTVRFTDGLDPATGFVWPYHAKMAPAGPMSPNSSTRTGVTTGAMEAQSVASWGTNIVTTPWQAGRTLPATVQMPMTTPPAMATVQMPMPVVAGPAPDALQGALAGLQQVGLTQTAGFNACSPPANYLQSVPAPQQQMSWAPQLMSAPSFSSFSSTPQQVTRMQSLPQLSQMIPSPSFPQQVGSVQMATPGSVQMAPPGSVQMAPPTSVQMAPPGSMQMAPPGSVQMAPPGSMQMAPPGSMQMAPPGSVQMAPPGSVQMGAPGSVQMGAPGSVQMATPAPGGGYTGGAYGMQLSPPLSNYRDMQPDQSALGYSTPLKYVVE